MKQFNRELLNNFTYKMSVKKYSNNTIKSYNSLLSLFFNYTKKQSKDISKGIDTRFIQEILGHEKLETTQKYLHVSAINISKIALKIA